MDLSGKNLIFVMAEHTNTGTPNTKDPGTRSCRWLDRILFC